jgi:uncharacterized repeat protein (TIGR01451 family)
MKNLLTTTLLVLALVFSGSFSCKDWRSSRRTDLVDVEYAGGFSSAEAYRPMIATSDESMSAASGESERLKVSRIYPAPEFAIIKMDKSIPKEVGLKKPFDYTIRVTNLTDATLTNVMVTEELSGNFKYMNSEPIAKENATNLVWRIHSLGPRSTEQILVSGMATDDKLLKLATSVVTHFVPAETDVKVVQPKLEFTQTAPAQAVICDKIPIEFEVTNTGTGSARNIRIKANFSDGLQTSDGKNELAVNVGNLTAGQSRRYSAKLLPEKAGKYVSKAIATAADLEDVSQETTINVGKPVLEIKKNGPKKQYVGRSVTYEITVINNSSAIARNTVIEDTIPAAVTSLKATKGAKLYRSRKIIWQLGTLEPKATKKVYVSYIPTRVGMLQDKTTATAYCADKVTASAETSIAGISGVLLEVIDVEDPVEVGTTTMYEIKVTNQGSAPATGIRITCTLEDNIRCISSSGATTGVIEGNVLKFAPLSTLSPKSRATWRVNIEAVKPADTRFKAAMITDQLSRPVEETEATHLYR